MSAESRELVELLCDLIRYAEKGRVAEPYMVEKMKAALAHSRAQDSGAPVNPWQAAVDNGRVVAHLGIAADGVSKEDAVRQLRELIDWHITVATDPAVNGGFKLVPVADAQDSGGEAVQVGEWSFEEEGNGYVRITSPDGRNLHIGYLPEGSRLAAEMLRDLAIALLPKDDEAATPPPKVEAQKGVVVDEVMVERAAEGLYAHLRPDATAPWAELNDYEADKLRDESRAALTAAFAHPPQEPTES